MLSDAFDEFDMTKAYTQFKRCPDYIGFPSVLHCFVNLKGYETDPFMFVKENVGFYQVRITDILMREDQIGHILRLGLEPNGVYTFTSPAMWTIEKNLFYLLKNSKEVDFEPKYKMRPDYLSFDEYGTVVLAHLLMYVNYIYCLEDFDLNTVIIPSFQAIVDIASDKFRKKSVEEMTEVDW